MSFKHTKRAISKKFEFLKNKLLPTIVASTILTGNPASGLTLTGGNLVVSVNEFTGTSFPPTYIAEYTTAGNRVQTISDVPAPGFGTRETLDRARDLVYRPNDAIYLYNGTRNPYLARFDLQTEVWTQTTAPGWSTLSNNSVGAIDHFNGSIFVADSSVPTVDPERGIYRFDTNGGQTMRFIESIQINDFDIGPDGILYGLDGRLFPRSKVFRFDPETFEDLGTLDLGDLDDHRGIGAWTDGSLFTASWNGMIRRYSPAGVLLDSLSVPNARFQDLDIATNGAIALGTGFNGEVVITDVSLDTFERFTVTESRLGGGVFVAWVPIPEPTSTTLIGLVGLALAQLYRTRIKHQ